MNTFKYTTLVLVFAFISSVSAQDYKFGKVSKEELEETQYTKDSSASAAVLYRKMSIRFNYTQGAGFNVVTNVHERVKIYNTAGFEYATVSEILYKNEGDRESMSAEKAFTYNLEGGQVVKQKMDKSGVFSTALSEYRDEEKFTLPNIKEGSVIEYEYKITSPFYYSIDEIALQYDIPIKKQEISIATPEYFVFKPAMKGYLPVNPQFGRKSGKINYTNKNTSGRYTSTTTYEARTIEYQINTVAYVMNDVPALKEEPFVNDMDNYRSAVNYELQYVQFPQSTRENYTTTWEEVVKKIYESDGFGGQLKSSKYFNDDLEVLVSSTSSKEELASAIFLHVKNRMSWNNTNGYSTDKGVKEAYKEKSGNIADINLILTAILQQAGIEANPVLVSTRDHGVPLFPTMEGFNYVITAVELEAGTVLLDATNKFAQPNLLPTRALNWYGRLIKEDGTSTSIDLLSKKVSRESINTSIVLNENGDISGKCRKVLSDYDAYLFRNKYSTATEDEYLEQLENANSGMEISGYEVKNKMILGKPVMESFEFDLEGQADVIADKIYFSPMFYMSLEENPFKLNERQYPIDFIYPWQERYILNIILPEGYKVESKPENVAMVLRDDLGGFKYQIVENGNSLQVMVDLKMNKSVIAASYYGELKELFKNAIEKETEKVVLSKITSDGTSDSSGEGR